jgi:dihydrofolate synthase / folylpolyglutamate synthase
MTPVDGASVGGPSPLAPFAQRRRGGAARGSHRAQALCAALGDPQLAQPAVHVVGTNGKTSVVKITAALLTALGVRVGDTTSPHLHHLDERIRLDGRALPPARLAALAALLPDAVARAEHRLGETVTFFDVVTAAALRAFADAAVDVAVVEAGIGGAGDATGLLTPAVTVCTPIGLDHPQLGATPAEVAAEKTGALAPDATLLSSAQVPAAAEVLTRRAVERGARLRLAGRDFGVVRRRPVGTGQLLELRGLGESTVRARLPLAGAHQADNAALALATVQSLLGTRDLDPERLRAGFAVAHVPGRLEIVARPDGSPQVVLDGAHDPEATTALATTLAHRMPGPRTIVVLGVSGGRDPARVLAPLAGMAAGVVVTAAETPGARRPDEVAATLRAAGHRVELAPGVEAALAMATRRAGPEGVVIVTGSLHLVARARGLLLHDPDRRPGPPCPDGTATRDRARPRATVPV